jgi:hypothetical protein
VLEQENIDLRRRLSEIATLAAGQAEEQRAPHINAVVPNQGKSSHREPKVVAGSGGKGAELRILRVLAQQHPARLAESQWAILSRMKRTGGTWQTYKSRLRSRGQLSRNELAARAGLTSNAGTFGTYLSRLRRTWLRAWRDGAFGGRPAARSRSGEPSQPLSAGSSIRRRSLDRGSSATHQRSCGFDPRIRV